MENPEKENPGWKFDFAITFVYFIGLHGSVFWTYSTFQFSFPKLHCTDIVLSLHISVDKPAPYFQSQLNWIEFSIFLCQCSYWKTIEKYW